MISIKHVIALPDIFQGVSFLCRKKKRRRRKRKERGKLDQKKKKAKKLRRNLNMTRRPSC
jgi:hypothetical protein